MTQDLDGVLADFKRTAVQRDREGGHPAAEKEQLRRLGLLRLSIPEAYGGRGRRWPEIMALVRRVAAVDSALAHLLAFHHLQVATVLIYGNEEQQSRWLTETAELQGWWGNGVNQLDQRLVATEWGEDFRLEGTKGFCSGTRGSSCMTLTARHHESGGFLMGIVRTGAPGLVVNDDWDPIGQRQTDSGSVSFSGVRLAREDVLRAHDAEPTPFQTLRNSFGQLILVNLYLGLAIGAFAEAKAYAHTQARPWVASGAERASDDPFTINRFGEMHVQVVAATALAERAAEAIDAAFRKGADLTAQGRADAALAIAEAKVLAHRAGLYASQELFEVVGARGTRASLGFDRFWRNVRTHTLHDPLDYKLNALGRWALNGELPSPQFYT